MIVRDKDVLTDLSARDRLQRVRERAVRRRGCLARARAGHGASHAAAARRARAGRRRHQRRRADESRSCRAFSSKPALLERTIKAIADHGARFVGCNVMHLEDGTRDHFMRWLSDEYPAIWSTAIAASMRGRYAPDGVSRRSAAVIDGAREESWTGESSGGPR